MVGGKAVRWAWIGTVSLAAVSLLARILHRGPYTPGWDVLGAAQGLFLVSTRSAGDIVAWHVTNHWSSGIGWNLYGVASVLVPGALAAIWPWEFWNHVATFAVTVLVVWLVAAAFELGWRAGWVVPLAWLASPALVSQSVTGLAYVTCALPHALAVYIVLRLRQHWVRTAVLGALVYLLAWQGQELGRTVWLLFLVAVLTVPALRGTRIVWLVTGGWIAADSLWHPTYNTALFGNLARLDASGIAGAALAVGERLFVRWSIDVPILFATGVVAAVLVRRERWLWRSLLAAQIALVVVLALQRGPDAVWARRFLLVDFYCLVAVVALFTDWRVEPRRAVALIALLGVAAVGQTWGALRFRHLASSVPTAVFTLPFVATNRVDYFVTPGDVEWARELLAEARAGKTLLLVYNHSSYREDPTNPSGVLERLYLNLGHERFTTQVVVFGDERRWIEIPIRPMRELDAFVDQIHDPGHLTGYLAIDPQDFGASLRARQGADERARVLRALERRFTIVWEDEARNAEPLQIRRFSLRARGGADSGARWPTVDRHGDMG